MWAGEMSPFMTVNEKKTGSNCFPLRKIKGSCFYGFMPLRCWVFPLLQNYAELFYHLGWRISVNVTDLELHRSVVAYRMVALPLCVVMAQLKITSACKCLFCLGWVRVENSQQCWHRLDFSNGSSSCIGRWVPTNMFVCLGWRGGGVVGSAFANVRVYVCMRGWVGAN